MSDEVTDSEFDGVQPGIPGTTANGGRGTGNKPSIGPDGTTTGTGPTPQSDGINLAEVVTQGLQANAGASKVFNIKIKGGPSGPYSAPSSGPFDGPDHLSPSMGATVNGMNPDGEINFFQAQSDGLLLAPPNIQRAINAATGGDPLIADAVYEAALQRTASKTALGQETNLISNIMEVAKEYRESQQGGGTGGGGGGGPFRSENTVVNLTNPQKSQEILNTALSVALGRRATASENRAFLAALNLREQENPTKTVTEGVSSGRNSTSSSTTTGGFDNVAFADKFARSQEGYAEYQAATTQMDNFIQALTGNRRRVI